MQDYKQADFWNKKAATEGYPACSVYTFEKIQDKYNIFTPDASVLDLGAAPGSWTLYLLRHLSERGRVVSVDIRSLDVNINDDRLLFIQGDMALEHISNMVKGYAPFQAVVCDVVSFMSDNKTIDYVHSRALVDIAFQYAKKYLYIGGNFVVKIFQDDDQAEYIKKIKDLFLTVRTCKPKVCCTDSFEIYVIGLGFKG